MRQQEFRIRELHKRKSSIPYRSEIERMKDRCAQLYEAGMEFRQSVTNEQVYVCCQLYLIDHSDVPEREVLHLIRLKIDGVAMLVPAYLEYLDKAREIYHDLV